MARLDPTGVSRILSYIKTWVTNALGGKANSSHSHTKSQITDFPTIPSNTSQLTNDSDYITSSGSCNYANSSGNADTLDGYHHDSFPKTSAALFTVNGLGAPGWSKIGTGEGGSCIQVKTTDNTYPSICFHRSGYSHCVLAESGGQLGTMQQGGSFNHLITSANIGSQSVNYATSAGSAGSVAWGNVSGRPWALSQFTNDSGFLTSHQDLSGYVPRSGGAVMTGGDLARTVGNGGFNICGGTEWYNGGTVLHYGGGRGDYLTGAVVIHTFRDVTARNMHIFPNGTWTWEGTACQITSDQRLKQQISNIDDKLLDAWEDVSLVQYKYNDAVGRKGDSARLHTGYVVQQIDEACKSHNLDISAYGLYCHEEYSERTEEVEVKQDDGSVIKETKVIEPAKEQYSLRYTEALIVECAYLRREVKRLSERLEKLEK